MLRGPRIGPASAGTVTAIFGLKAAILLLMVDSMQMVLVDVTDFLVESSLLAELT